MRSGVRTVLVVLAVAGLAALLAGCGESAPDEFVGTWRTPDGSPPDLVIAKTDEGYRATLVLAEAQPHCDLTRVGEMLRGTMTVGVGDVAVEIVYQPQSGDVTWSNAIVPEGSMNAPSTMVRVSTSTAIVTPSPF